MIRVAFFLREFLDEIEHHAVIELLLDKRRLHDRRGLSVHFLLDVDGTLYQTLDLRERAWHAGESFFRGRRCCNDFSIGIELEGDDETPYDERQYLRLPAVLQALFLAYPGLSARELAGHCDIAPGRKSDPGPAFDWLRLYDALGANGGTNNL